MCLRFSPYHFFVDSWHFRGWNRGLAGETHRHHGTSKYKHRRIYRVSPLAPSFLFREHRDSFLKIPLPVFVSLIRYTARFLCSSLPSFSSSLSPYYFAFFPAPFLPSNLYHVKLLLFLPQPFFLHTMSVTRSCGRTDRRVYQLGRVLYIPRDQNSRCLAVAVANVDSHRTSGNEREREKKEERSKK